MLRIHSTAANGEGDSELGTQSRTAKILSLFARWWAKVKQRWKEKQWENVIKGKLENGKCRSVELSREAEGRTAQLDWVGMVEGRTDGNKENMSQNW